MMVERKELKLKLTPEQKKTVDEMRRRLEKEKPELIAEGKRVRAAEAPVSARLQAAMGLLKAIRKVQSVTLDELAKLTGMTKPYLSKLENDESANITVNTLYRIADALDHDLEISVIPRTRRVLKKRKTMASGK